MSVLFRFSVHTLFMDWARIEELLKVKEVGWQ